MNKTNPKTIQNYILQQIKPYSSQLVEFWSAKHKILKKNFLLKKINILAYRNIQIHLKIEGLTRQQWLYQNSLNEINILKRQNLQHIPKCHKIIKTSNSIYLVYDQFPASAIDDILVKCTKTRLEKLQLLLSIATQLNYFHLQPIVFTTLSTNNIHISGKNQVLFSDWSLARDMHQGKIIGFEYLFQRKQFIADQVKERGQFSLASDIFSIGKIFQKIMQSQFNQNPTNDDLKLQGLLSKMTKRNPVLRPSLKYVMGILQSLKTNEWSAHLKKTLTKSKSSNILKDIHSLSKNSTRTNSEQNQKWKQKKQIPVLSQRYCLHTKSTISLLHSNLKQSSNEDAQIMVKQICKKRNLAFFILSLAEFIVKMQRCTQLAFLLVKYARIVLKSIIDQLEEKTLDNKLQKVLSILQNEESNILRSQILLKNSINPQKCAQPLKIQLQQQKLVNKRFLKSKIVQFGKQMVIVCEHQTNAKIDQRKISYNLFHTLLLLKYIEEGSFEKFWEKHYDIDFINLSNQQVMKEEQKLGHRYLKSKIAQILSLKSK